MQCSWWRSPVTAGRPIAETPSGPGVTFSSRSRRTSTRCMARWERSTRTAHGWQVWTASDPDEEDRRCRERLWGLRLRTRLVVDRARLAAAEARKQAAASRWLLAL